MIFIRRQHNRQTNSHPEKKSNRPASALSSGDLNVSPEKNRCKSAIGLRRSSLSNETAVVNRLAESGNLRSLQ